MTSRNPVDELLARDLIFVTGKGGTGKTTVAATLGLAAAQHGKRTLIYELGQERQLCDLFEVELSRGKTDQQTELAENLFTASVDYDSAMRKWLAEQLRIGPVVDFVASSNSFKSLFTAAPGAREVVCWREIITSLSKSNGFDLVIVDGPASGHGFGMLKAPSSYAKIARSGPIHKRIAAISHFLADRSRTAVVCVTQASELPVNETIELDGQLRDELDIQLAAVCVNELYPKLLASEANQIKNLDHDENSSVAIATRAARSRVQREKNQLNELQRLRSDLPDTPMLELPFLFTRSIDSRSVVELADELTS